MRRLLHRRIGGFRATRNFVDKGGALAVHVEKIGAIRHQAAGFGEGRVLVDRGQLGRHHQLHQLAALRIEQRRGQHKQGLRLVIGDRGKRAGEIFAARGPEHLHLETLDGGGRGCITHALFGRAGRVRIDGQRQAQRLGQQFAQHLDALLIEQVSTIEMPVTLPPGRARLATRPVPTGALTAVITIGTARVACCVARTAAMVLA